jgi:hypothetical protein
MKVKGMKKSAALFALLVFVSACQPVPVTPAAASLSPPPETLPAPFSTVTPCPPAPVYTATSTQAAQPDYNRRFLDAIGVAPASCLPDKTAADIGIYIYDLTHGRELVSINADTAFQFASAFKGPALVYFLSTCQKYWNPSDPAWEAYFRDPRSVRNAWYVSDAYREAIVSYLSDINNWRNVEAFFTRNRAVNNGGEWGPIDRRYFILQQVYRMIAYSGNADTADVLRFVNENCLSDSPPVIEARCGSPNAITAFNAWLYAFAGIVYRGDEPRRGLYNWNIVYERDENGEWVGTPLSTNGFKDACANKTALLNCRTGATVKNVMSPRDFFRFYLALYNLEDASTRRNALELLKVDLEGPARGNLKNMARNMNAEAMSKNGYYYYGGPVLADAGIVRYRGVSFVVVTLSYDAQDAMEMLYGTYVNGALKGGAGLIQSMLDEIAP